MLQIVINLKHRYNSIISFDIFYPNIDESILKECNWKHFYGGVNKSVPPDASKTRGKDVELNLFVDSDKEVNKQNQLSST